MTATLDDLNLLPRHFSWIEARGITAEVAVARGYASETTKTGFKRRGFSDSQCLPPALILPVWDVLGHNGLCEMRPDTPRTINGKVAKYELPRGSGIVIDVPPTVRGMLLDRTVPLFVTEGIAKADAAASRGLCCIDVLGVWGWKGTNLLGGKTALPDWNGIALNGRDVFLVFDSDVMVKPTVWWALHHLGGYLQKLQKARPHFVYLPAAENGAKVGLDDFFAAGGMVADLFAFATDHLRPLRGDDGDAPDAKSRESHATRLVRLTEERGAEFFHSPDGRAFVTHPVGEHRETEPVRSTAFRRWLAMQFFAAEERAPGGEAISEAVAVLEGRALLDGAAIPVFVRVAEWDRAIYIDLGDARWRAVQVDAAGWRIVEQPPVRFHRARGMLSLPEPQMGGSLSDLRPFLNVASHGDFLLLLAWELAALRPSGPYPLLTFIGEQGTGKSTAQRVLRAVLDPNSAGLRAAPKETRDLMIAARNGWVLVFDNMSTLPEWLSDSLCRLSTGGGFATRGLYTDDDEVIFDATRPIALNGITDFVRHGDLVDRSLLITLAKIPEAERRPEKRFWAEFDVAAPRILGALLSAVSRGLATVESVRLQSLPRMADFAEWGYAALGDNGDAFLAAYRENRAEANSLPLEGEPIVEPLQALAEAAWKVGNDWMGTASELLAALGVQVGESVTKRRDWPGNGRVLSGSLRRLAPALRPTGLDVHFEREPHSRRRLINLREVGDSCVPNGPNVPPEPENDESWDASGATGDARTADAEGFASPESDVYEYERDADAAGASLAFPDEGPRGPCDQCDSDTGFLDGCQPGEVSGWRCRTCGAALLCWYCGGPPEPRYVPAVALSQSRRGCCARHTSERRF